MDNMPHKTLDIRSRSQAALAHGGGLLELRNPGDLNHTFARVMLADADDARLAMDAAHEAFFEWRAVGLEARISLLSKALDALEARTEAVAACITWENGKPLTEARGEVKASLADGRYQLAMAGRMPVEEAITELDGGSVGTVRHCPIGVQLLITPWNFPLATVVRKLIPALVWGNSVVSKPAQQTPLAPSAFFDCLEQAGLPANAAQLIIGKGSVVGDPLVDHPKLRGISFTGSTEVGTGICQRVAARNVRTQMEMGGKNALIVLADADVDAAVEAARTAAFTCSGQWCTATSRVIVEASVYEAFAEKLVRSVGQLKLGPGHIDGVSFGPVASATQKDTALKAIETATAEGAELLCGGRGHEQVEGCPGHFVEPTVFGQVGESMALFKEEVFGPVLALSPAADLDEAIRLANASPYGLSFSVYTASQENAARVLDAVEAGMVHHNLHTAVRHPAMPVTGWKESGRGVPECGRYGRDFYTQPKAIYAPSL
jgi:aldehyde dehydrogenase (NAD+)